MACPLSKRWREGPHELLLVGDVAVSKVAAELDVEAALAAEMFDTRVVVGTILPI